MARATVLHVARDWVRPSERFVADLVTTTTATRAVVATGRIWPDASTQVKVHDIAKLARLEPGTDGLGADSRRKLRIALAAIALRERADLLHAHFGYWGAHTAKVASWLGKPWALSLHGHDLLVADPASPQAAGLRTAALVAVPSAYLADEASNAGFHDEAIRVLPSGVDLANFSFRERVATTSNNRITVTFAGRFVAKKGIFDAVEAIAAAKQKLPELNAVFVGSGPLEAELRDRLRTAGVDAEIRDGSVAGAVLEALQETDLLLMPSRTAETGDAETLGLVAIEAQAFGVPVIATRHGGLVEAIGQDAGELVPEGDVPALANALVRIAGDPARWAAMGRAGRAHVAARFELGARTAAVEAAYREVLAGRLPPKPQPRPAAGANPHVTVVMVTHNRRAMCELSVAAIRAQTYQNLDVAIVDNACTDGTADDLQTAVAADERIRVITAEHHWPPVVARNRAVAGSTAAIVAFTDDDCYPIPTWVESLVAGFAADEELGIVQGRTSADPEGRLKPLSRTQWTPAEFGLYETANIAYRRDLLGDAPFDETFARRIAAVLGPRIGKYPFGEDTELAWRLKRRGAKSRFAATALVHHAVHDPDPSLLIRRAVVGAGFPLVIQRVPELRDTFLWHKIFLGPKHAALIAAVLGTVALPKRPALGIALAVPYAAMMTRPTRRGRKARLKAAPVLVVRDVIEISALFYGSARSGSLVL